MVRTRGLLVFGISALGLVGMAVRPAQACSAATGRPHPLDPALVGIDLVPPEWEHAPEIVHRDRGQSGGGCLVAGKPPKGLRVPAEDLRPFGTAIQMPWNDGASDSQEAFLFTLSVTPVDLAGNLGETRTVVVSDPGSGGCAVAGSAAGSAWPLVVVVLVGRSAWRRRRTRLSRRSPGSEIDRR